MNNNVPVQKRLAHSLVRIKILTDLRTRRETASAAHSSRTRGDDEQSENSWVRLAPGLVEETPQPPLRCQITPFYSDQTHPATSLPLHLPVTIILLLLPFIFSLHSCFIKPPPLLSNPTHSACQSNKFVQYHLHLHPRQSSSRSPPLPSPYRVTYLLVKSSSLLLAATHHITSPSRGLQRVIPHWPWLLCPGRLLLEHTCAPAK